MCGRGRAGEHNNELIPICTSKIVSLFSMETTFDPSCPLSRGSGISHISLGFVLLWLRALRSKRDCNYQLNHRRRMVK